MTEPTAIATHPVQTRKVIHARPVAPQAVTRKAYEVYAHVYGPQPALITGECRGGFGVGELIALLYASSFPKAEWSARVEEGLSGLML